MVLKAELAVCLIRAGSHSLLVLSWIPKAIVVTVPEQLTYALSSGVACHRLRGRDSKGVGSAKLPVHESDLRSRQSSCDRPHCPGQASSPCQRSGQAGQTELI